MPIYRVKRHDKNDDLLFDRKIEAPTEDIARLYVVADDKWPAMLTPSPALRRPD
jgi:hypothetical protein